MRGIHINNIGANISCNSNRSHSFKVLIDFIQSSIFLIMRRLFKVGSDRHDVGRVTFTWHPEGNFLASAGKNGIIEAFFLFY